MFHSAVVRKLDQQVAFLKCELTCLKANQAGLDAHYREKFQSLEKCLEDWKKIHDEELAALRVAAVHPAVYVYPTQILHDNPAHWLVETPSWTAMDAIKLLLDNAGLNVTSKSATPAEFVLTPKESPKRKR